jgi:hypothetical protein
MEKDMEKWAEDYRKKLDAEKKIKADLSKKVLKLFKGVDRTTTVPQLLADIFESLDYEDGEDDLDNQIMQWGIDHYVSRKVKKVIPKLHALYNYCVDEKYTIDNTFEWGSGDRCVCYIPTTDDKQVLYFTNQNVQFVCLLTDSVTLHIREVYEDIFDEKNLDYGFYTLGSFPTVNHLREALKQDNGLEIAMLNLNSKYKKWSDCVEGNEYPERISLKNMIDCNFSDKCKAFTYNDTRDAGYILSLSFMSRCELNDYNRAKYVFSDVSGATNLIPKRYLDAIERDDKLNDILGLLGL